MFGFVDTDDLLVSCDRLDINDEDGTLVRQMSSLYHQHFHIKREVAQTYESWLRSNIYKDLVHILSKHNDMKWLFNDKSNQLYAPYSRHRYCIYYAGYILGTLCRISESMCNKILNEPQFVSSILSLWKGSSTWMESTCATKAIVYIMQHNPKAFITHKDAQNVNIITSAIDLYINCVKSVLKTCIVPDKMNELVIDLLNITGGKMYEHDYNVLVERSWIKSEDWSALNLQILYRLAETNDKSIMDMFESVTTAQWEDACGMALCWIWCGELKIRLNSLDLLIYVTKHEKCAEIISKSDLIIKCLIMKLYSRTCMHKRYDLIIYNLLKFNLIPIIYYNDLCLGLLLLLEFDRKYEYVAVIRKYSDKTVFEVIIQCLKLLFNIPLKFQFINYTKIPKKFKCSNCNNVLNNPYKIKCQHNYCFLCIINKLTNFSEEGKCVVKHCKRKKFQFKTKKDEKFDYELFNEINGSNIQININKNETFIGTMSECWRFIKNKLNQTQINKLHLNKEFEYFCDFMIKETSIKNVNDSKQLQIAARNKREEGNKNFKNEKYFDAIECYKESLNICPHLCNTDRCTYYSNLSITYLKINEYFEAYKAALNGLAINFHHIKLLNILSKCYSEIKINKIFSTINIDPIRNCDNNLYLNRAYYVILYNFYNHFENQYLQVKSQKQQNLYNVRSSVAWDDDNSGIDEFVANVT